MPHSVYTDPLYGEIHWSAMDYKQKRFVQQNLIVSVLLATL